jgi:hypothetical protein
MREVLKAPHSSGSVCLTPSEHFVTVMVYLFRRRATRGLGMGKLSDIYILLRNIQEHADWITKRTHLGTTQKQQIRSTALMAMIP